MEERRNNNIGSDNGRNEDDQAFRDKIRSDDSKTFNEDEPTWKEEKSQGGLNEGAEAGYGETSNAGTEGNNWDANDQTQRGNGLHGDERSTDQEGWKEENRGNGGAGTDYGTP